MVEDVYEYKYDKKTYNNYYNEINKEHIAKQKKEYYERNKEKFKDYHKEYYEKNQEHIAVKDKERRQKNKEHIAEKAKEYRENNKDVIKEKKNEKMTCECGCEVTRNHLSEHRKTKKHNKLMEAKKKNMM